MANFPKTIVMKREELYRRCFFSQTYLDTKHAHSVRNDILQVVFMSTVGV